VLEVSVKADCGNAPKKIFLKEFTIAYAKHVYKFVLNSFAGAKGNSIKAITSYVIECHSS
jgi:hypothetical protein